MNSNILIKKYLNSVIKPNNEKTIYNEHIAYKFVCNFFQKYENKIIPLIQKKIRYYINIIEEYCNAFNFSKDKYLLDNLFVSIDKKSQNSGAVLPSIKNLHDMINTPNTNIRELYCVIDEILHNCCDAISWYFYTQYCTIVNPNNLLTNDSQICDKLRFIATVITGSNQKWFDNPITLKMFINKTLGVKYDTYSGKSTIINNTYPWNNKKSFPSVCHLWFSQERTYPTHKLLFKIEYQRYVDRENDEYFDNKKFNPSLYCDEKCGYSENQILISDIYHPVLTARELEYMNEYKSRYSSCKEKSLNTVTWKGGCCYYYAHENTITYKISELFNKPRTTSYSGHTIMEMELFYIFDDFPIYKELYILCTCYSMIPYCHHTYHEIMLMGNSYNINYNITKSYESNINKLINSFNHQLLALLDTDTRELILLLNTTIEDVNKYYSF